MALKFKSVSSAATSQTIGLQGATGLTIKNDGTDPIFFKLFTMLDPESAIAAATTSDSTMTSSDAAMNFYRPEGLKAISIACDTAKTATVRLWYI